MRLSLMPVLMGSVIVRAGLARGRRDIVTGPASPDDLLQGCRVVEIRRKGKQMAIIAVPLLRGTGRARQDNSPRVLVVHLGMSGQLVYSAPGGPPARTDHVHAQWTIVPASAEHDAGALTFRDPRRFGGLWTLRGSSALDEHWRALGSDAAGPDLGGAIQRVLASRRAIKAALLDQRVVAGIGNIYADESLFDAGIAPQRRADSLTPRDLERLIGAISRVLRTAIDAGGSTIRDYLDAQGGAGTFQTQHKVYARAGLPCVRCGGVLLTAPIAQRTTVWCPRCQG